MKEDFAVDGQKKHLNIGILAHADAGKTTLAEALLYTTGKIRKLGRVDSRNTFLDTHYIERDRGITVFSKQARMESEKFDITLIDTPGHTDFAPEAERGISAADYALLVISGSEGVQPHTVSLWEMLARYSIPVYLFVTKMDMSHMSKESLLSSMTGTLSDGIIDFSYPDSRVLAEKAALADEEALSEFLETDSLSDSTMISLIRDRKVFPVIFGSGLRLEGVDRLISLIDRYSAAPEYGDEFAARVYKIGHDLSGQRLTYMKITGGSLSVRQSLVYSPREMPDGDDDENGTVEEKVTGIRLYSGAKYENCDTVTAGCVCAVCGLTMTFAGMTFGKDDSRLPPFFEPVINHKINLPKGCDAREMFRKLKPIEEEEPLLRLVWDPRLEEIHAQITGQIQREVLISLVRERLGVEISFGTGAISYKETVSKPVIGIGHFEPLRHYAEVHVFIEPAENGQGVTVDTVADSDILSQNWQRLIMSCLEDKRHRGVLTGSPLTDVRITLAAGRAHLKHTHGGDFREAACRAVRQGLMTLKAQGGLVLLEPYYSFVLEIPEENTGKAISDVVQRGGRITERSAGNGITVIRGTAPVASVNDYAESVSEYTHGLGRFVCTPAGFFPCHDTDDVVSESGYDPEADLRNPPHSVFCSHGSGFIVPWNEVPEYAHLTVDGRMRGDGSPEVRKREKTDIDEKELEAIMEREFGPIRRKIYGKAREAAHAPDVKNRRFRKSVYIIDGYNVIFANDKLSSIASSDLDGAREHLIDILVNYKGYTDREIVVVFDAYNVKGAAERKYEKEGVNIVYTREGELGDTYIERFIHEIGRDYSVRTVTSDSLIQLQALRTGVLRLSAREFWAEIEAVDSEIEEILERLSSESSGKQ